MAPATAQSAAPMPNTPVKSTLILMPMAMAISRLDAPARTQAPIRVLVTKTKSSKAMAKPTAMMTKR